MRIAFCYPPFSKDGRFPNLPQNRQFIYTASREVRVFPVVMATAATWLKNSGHEILWLDGITKRLDQTSFDLTLALFKPDLIILESKAPIMNKVWEYINKIKDAKVALVGDHVTFFPEESFKKSKVDYVLTGGDYDFLLVNLVKHLTEGEKLEEGIWCREFPISNSKFQISNRENKILKQDIRKNRHPEFISGSPEILKQVQNDVKCVTLIKNTGKFKIDHNLDKTPVIDRELTCWKDYGEAYLFHPCAYVMFGRGCGIDSKRTGACKFCIWQQALWRYSARLMSPERAVAEVKNLVKLGVREIFDDAESGVLSNYNWLENFYDLLKKEKVLGKISFASNARGDQLDIKTCKILKKIGYRLLKVGLESGADKTLMNIQKKETLTDIIRGVKNAKDQNLRVMLTIMTGYPWEEEIDVKKTLNVTRDLMFYKTRAGDCLQASVITPYPGILLWHEAKKNGWLKINPDNLEEYDMSKPILKSKIDAEYWCQQIWSVQKDFQFILRSATTVRDIKELFLLLRGAKSLLGHIKDYSKI